MKPFCKLLDPSRYEPCEVDLTTDEPARMWWVLFFRSHFLTLLKLGVESAVAHGGDRADAERRAEDARARFHAICDAYLAKPAHFGRVTVLTLDTWRDGTLRQCGFADVFRDIKDRENGRMLPVLPVITRQVDALSGREQATDVIEAVFAGNVFDMGSEATAKKFLDQSPDFFAVLARLAPRPWLIDDLDPFLDRLLNGPPYRKMIFFVDNAGSDFMVGALTMMRWMAMRGTRLVLAANELPTLNDMTIHDARRWWPRIIQAEPSLASLPIELVSTGTAEPLLDLRQVSDELNDAAADADLVVLEGMGRGIESNLNARFTCDSARLAMVKMDFVAQRLGGKLFDLVCRFWPAAHQGIQEGRQGCPD